MKASSLSRRVRTVLVTGAVAAMGLSVMPARAAQVPPPIAGSTSLSAGNTWSKINTVIAVDYNQKIDVAASSVTVVDAASIPATLLEVDTAHHFVGVTRVDDDRSILYFATPKELPFTEEDGPYNATFTAHAVNQVTGSADTVTTYTFRVDKKAPPTPAPVVFGAVPTLRDTTIPNPQPNQPPIAIPSRESLPKSVAVLQSGESAKISGLVKDTADAEGNFYFASGIERVEVRFYNGTAWDGTPPSTTRPLPLASGEALDQRVTLPNTCAPALCAAQQSFQITKDLPPGYWSMRVLTFDLAGNPSGESSAIGIVVLKGA